jgi:hypothetical protein
MKTSAATRAITSAVAPPTETILHAQQAARALTEASTVSVSSNNQNEDQQLISKPRQPIAPRP